MVSDLPDPAALVAELAAHPSIRGKLDIAAATRSLGLGADTAGRPGDDAAALPRPGGGWDLFAGEGFIPGFVEADPWFAGWCGVMVNLSDIAAMGGRADALINALWAPNIAAAAPLLAGLRAASEAYGVPIVGGHTNLRSPGLGLSVSVTGRARRLISSFAARPGDALIAAIDHRGSYRNFDNFCAALNVPAQRLRGDLQLLPDLAEAGLVGAGKDISQGGVIGTSLMLAECSDCGFDVDLGAVPVPDGIPLNRWLRSFPSFGFLLSVRPDHAAAVCARFAACDITAAVIGWATPSPQVALLAGSDRAIFWDHASRPYLSLKPEAEHA